MANCLVSASKTTNPSSKKRAAVEWQAGLNLLHALSRLGTARLSLLRFVSAWKTTNPSSKKKAAGEWQTCLYLLHALSGIGTAELSPPRFLFGKQHTFN